MLAVLTPAPRPASDAGGAARRVLQSRSGGAIMRCSSLSLLGTLLIISCSSDMAPTEPSVVAHQTLAAAEVTHEVLVQEPVAFVMANPCTGEEINFSGFFSGTAHFTINDNRVNGHFSGVERLKGVGVSTAEQYQYVFPFLFVFGGSLIQSQYSETSINVFRVVGRGPDDNFVVHIAIHFTVNANGETTATPRNVQVECR